MGEEAREMLAGEMSHRVKNLFAIALVVHELATNSIEYGALSVLNGGLDVSLASSA
jgi:two-component sensor histidine kinase